MATEYHLTPEGPRPCSVDRSNPNSRGCPLGGMHFDSFDDAMEVYTEDLKKTFGEFHVLVRPSGVEKIRRLGYRSLDGIERARANPQVDAAVKSLKTLRSKAREAISEIRSHYAEKADPQRSSVLPESVATEPLVQEAPEDREAEELSEEVFSTGEPESLQDFGARIRAKAAESKFAMEPLDRSELDEVLEAIAAREVRQKSTPRKLPEHIRAQRSAAGRRATVARMQAKAAIGSGARIAKAKLSDAGYAARASASLAKDAAVVRARTAGARAQAATRTIGRAAQQRASQMSIPAGHIRPGDTFDGTRVRAVESMDDGKVKISYQARPGGPILATTVAGDRAMRVDRKTRREARNSRISSRIARPIAQTRALSQRVARASSQQLSSLGSIRSKDLRFAEMDRIIRQHERDLRQRELIETLKGFRSSSTDRALQRS